MASERCRNCDREECLAVRGNYFNASLPMSTLNDCALHTVDWRQRARLAEAVVEAAQAYIDDPDEDRVDSWDRMIDALDAHRSKR